MNIFVGTANSVTALTIKLSWSKACPGVGMGIVERELMLHADFAYAFDSQKDMWVWIKCRYDSLTQYEYFSERDIQEVIAYHSGCKINKLRQVTPLTKSSKVEELLLDFKRIQQAKHDERF